MPAVYHHPYAHVVRPSVLVDGYNYSQHSQPPSLDGYSSTNIQDDQSSPSRRQRISMACRYCRRRKIRCCGGAPCKNCEKVNKACDYEPVPDEVNKATREKKAASKAARQTHHTTPNTVYTTPYYQPLPTTYDASYLSVPAPRPVHLGHRRSSSAPNPAQWQAMTYAPPVASPTSYDNGMQQAWYSNTPSYPSVLAPMQEYQAEPYQMPSTWSVPDMQYMAPQIHMPETPMNPRSGTTSSATLSSTASMSSPNTPLYYAPSVYHTPYAPSSTHATTSPTLAPEYKLHKDGLIGLGISQSQQNTPTRHTLQPSAQIGGNMDESYFPTY